MILASSRHVDHLSNWEYGYAMRTYHNLPFFNLDSRGSHAGAHNGSLRVLPYLYFVGRRILRTRN